MGRASGPLHGQVSGRWGLRGLEETAGPALFKLRACAANGTTLGAGASHHMHQAGRAPSSTPPSPHHAAVHNEFLKLRPDLGPVMTENWYFDRKGEVPAGKQPFFAIPAFNYFLVRRGSMCH